MFGSSILFSAVAVCNMFLLSEYYGVLNNMKTDIAFDSSLQTIGYSNVFLVESRILLVKSPFDQPPLGHPPLIGWLITPSV